MARLSWPVVLLLGTLFSEVQRLSQHRGYVSSILKRLLIVWKGWLFWFSSAQATSTHDIFNTTRRSVSFSTHTDAIDSKPGSDRSSLNGSCCGWSNVRSQKSERFPFAIWNQHFSMSKIIFNKSWMLEFEQNFWTEISWMIIREIIFYIISRNYNYN